jgi:hypothetical protein
MDSIVIGSGITGLNTALALLEKGANVELWDIGFVENLKTYNSDNFLDLKKKLKISSEILIGDNSKFFPEPIKQNLFDIPPQRNYFLKNNDLKKIFNDPIHFDILLSHSFGGLANGWGANTLPYNENDIQDWNLDNQSFFAAQSNIFNSIPTSKVSDDINFIFNIKSLGTERPIKLDKRDLFLISKFRNNKRYFINQKFAIGKARLAIKNSKTSDSCSLCARCLWGCPNNAIYNPIHSTFISCRKFKNFKYFPGRKVISFEIENKVIKKINFIENRTLISKSVLANIFLSAGAIQSGIIFKATLKKNNISEKKFKTSLLDTKKVKIVYLIPAMLKAKFEKKSIQLTRLIGGMNVESGNYKSKDYVHLEFLNLNSIFYQPLINSIPLPLRLSKIIFYNFFTALGVCTYYLPDKISEDQKLLYDNYSGKFNIKYVDNDEKVKLDKTIEKKLKNIIYKLGSIPLKTIRYNSGAGVHYAGTIPMGSSDEYPVNNFGRVKFIENLYICDSSAFPNLPSKPVSLNAASFARYVVNNIYERT